MDKPFTGFSTDRQKTIRMPEGFFLDVLPQIGSMLEMKLTLFLFWRLARGGPTADNRQRTIDDGAKDTGSTASSSNVQRPTSIQAPRMLSLADLEADAGLRSALARNKGPRPVEEAIREALELAVARGTILQLWVREEPNDVSEGRAEQWFVLNTRENRDWIEALANGQIDVSQTPLAGDASPPANGTANGNHSPASPTRIRVIAERPSVYALYEQNIGLLTPILAERLQDAEGRYPMEWIAAAFEEAVTNNKRNWRYIERILERWAAEGKDSGKDREPAGRGLDPDKYTRGKYAFLFRQDK